MKTRGTRWYDGTEYPVTNGAELAKSRAQKNQKKEAQVQRIHIEKKKSERRKRIAGVNEVLCKAQEALARSSNEFEGGSFRLLSNGSLDPAERKRVMYDATDANMDQGSVVSAAAWIPGGFQQSIVCTRGTKHLPQRNTEEMLHHHAGNDTYARVKMPIGYQGCVRLFSS
jgi:hypothetical protein